MAAAAAWLVADDTVLRPADFVLLQQQVVVPLLGGVVVQQLQLVEGVPVPHVQQLLGQLAPVDVPRVQPLPLAQLVVPAEVVDPRLLVDGGRRRPAALETLKEQKDFSHPPEGAHLVLQVQQHEVQL
jgi:hypothetical protein